MMLGNFSVKRIEDRLGVKFSESAREFLSKTRQESANNIGKGQWHCFDMPFVMVCGDKETADKIHSLIKDKASEMKDQIELRWC